MPIDTLPVTMSNSDRSKSPLTTSERHQSRSPVPVASSSSFKRRRSISPPVTTSSKQHRSSSPLTTSIRDLPTSPPITSNNWNRRINDEDDNDEDENVQSTMSECDDLSPENNGGNSSKYNNYDDVDDDCGDITASEGGDGSGCNDEEENDDGDDNTRPKYSLEEQNVTLGDGMYKIRAFLGPSLKRKLHLNICDEKGDIQYSLRFQCGVPGLDNFAINLGTQKVRDNMANRLPKAISDNFFIFIAYKWSNSENNEQTLSMKLVRACSARLNRSIKELVETGWENINGAEVVTRQQYNKFTFRYIRTQMTKVFTDRIKIEQRARTITVWGEQNCRLANNKYCEPGCLINSLEDIEEKLSQSDRNLVNSLDDDIKHRKDSMPSSSSLQQQQDHREDDVVDDGGDQRSDVDDSDIDDSDVDDEGDKRSK